MQVRSIEFQEHFGRVPVETSRQQSLLLREPVLAQQQAGQAMADEHVLGMSRPNPTTETEGTVVDPDAGQESGEHKRSEDRHQETDASIAEEAGLPRDPRTAGRKLDVVA